MDRKTALNLIDDIRDSLSYTEQNALATLVSDIDGDTDLGSIRESLRHLRVNPYAVDDLREIIEQIHDEDAYADDDDD